MATTLALAMRASMSATGVVSGANDASRAMDKMGRQAEQTARDVSAIKNLQIGQIVAKGVGSLADMLTSAGRSALSYATSVANAVDHTHDLAERTGMAVESLQVLQMAAKLGGVEDVTTAVQKLAVSIGKASESGNTDAFTKLGLDFETLRSMSPDEQFRAVQRAIAALSTPAEKAAAAVALFGRSGVELLPLFNQNLEEIEQRMRRLGAVVGQDQVAAIAQMNDALDMVRATFDGIIGQVVGNLAPVVTEMAESFLQFVESYNGVGGQGGTGIANALTEGLFSVVESLAQVVDTAVAAFNEAANVFKQAAAVMSAGRSLSNLPSWAASSKVGKGARAGGAAVQAGGVGGVGAADSVRGLRDRFRESQTPEAEARRKANREKRDEERRAAAEAQVAADRAAREADKAQKDAEKVREETRTAEEKHAAEVNRLDKLRAANAIDEQTYQRAKAMADERLQDEQEKIQQKLMRDAADAQQKTIDRVKKLQAVDERMTAKQQDIDKINAEKAAALGGKSNEALKANDIRSSEGMAQFLALATGREDPAIEENRKTNAKLEEIRKELRALQQEKVDILGAAA